MLGWYGNPVQQCPPLRGVSPDDFADPAQRSRFSEWNVMIKHMIKCIEQKTGNSLPSTFTEDEALRLLNVGCELLPSSVTSKPRTLKVTTVLRLVRESTQQADPNRRRVPFRSRKRRKNAERTSSDAE